MHRLAQKSPVAPEIAFLELLRIKSFFCKGEGNTPGEIKSVVAEFCRHGVLELVSDLKYATRPSLGYIFLLFLFFFLRSRNHYFFSIWGVMSELSKRLSIVRNKIESTLNINLRIILFRGMIRQLLSSHFVA
jgi:hypothetical protein